MSLNRRSLVGRMALALGALAKGKPVVAAGLPAPSSAADTAAVQAKAAERKDNYFRRVVHTFPRIRSDRLRITARETNGSKTAGIYEVRIYNQTESFLRSPKPGNVIYDKLMHEFRTVPSATF